MSASLFWSLPSKEEVISCGPTVRDVVSKVFGDKIESFDIPKLEAMFAASGDKGYEEIIELVRKYETINIAVRY